MPKYRVTLSDGRAVTVEADQAPSEEDVLGALGQDTPATDAPTTFANEPTTYGEGFRKSLLDTATRTGGSIVKGAARMLDPRTYLTAPGDEHERMRAEATGERAPSADYGMADVRAMGESLTTPEGGGEAIGSLLMGGALPRIGPRILTKIPAARQAVGGAVERAGVAMDSGGPMAGITRNAIGSTAGAVVGGPVGAAIGGAAGVAAPAVVRGAGRLIRGRVPPVAEAPPSVSALTPPPVDPPPVAHGPGSTPPVAPIAEPGPMYGPHPKPRLSAQETAAMLREMHGSEQAGKMLYGPVQRGSDVGSVVKSAAARKGAIKTLTPEGTTKLPDAPKAELAARLATSSPDEALAYADLAPNNIAQDYFGQQLTTAAGELAPELATGSMPAARTVAEAQLRAALLARLSGK